MATEPLPAHIVPLVSTAPTSRGLLEAKLLVEVDSMMATTLLHEGEVKEISVVRHIDCWLSLFMNKSRDITPVKESLKEQGVAKQRYVQHIRETC
jgi:hypothetical protein